MRAGLLCLVLLCTGCASTGTTPESLTQMLQLQLRERAGLYPGSTDVQGHAHEAQYAALKAWAERQNIVVTTAALDRRNQRGSIQPGTGGVIILINEAIDPDDQLYTLAHELGHLFGPHPLNDDASEVFAEIVAAMVCQQLGLNVWPQTTAYLAGRVPDLELQARTVQQHGALMDAVVAKLTKAATASR